MNPSYLSRSALTGGLVMIGQSLAGPTFMSISQADSVHPKHLGRAAQSRCPYSGSQAEPRGASLDGKVGSMPWGDTWAPCWWDPLGGMLRSRKGLKIIEMRLKWNMFFFKRCCRMALSQGNQKFIFLFCSSSFHPNSPRSSIQLHYGLNQHWGIGLGI